MTHTVSIHALKAAFESEHYPKLFSGREIHEPALKLVAQLTRWIGDPDLIKEAVVSGFPKDYSGNTLSELDRMIDGAFKKNFDQPSTKKGEPPQKEQMLEAVNSEEHNLFADRDGRAYIAIQLPEGGEAVHPVRSGATRRWLIQTYFKSTGKAPAAKSVAELIDLFEAIALDNKKLDQVFIRVGGGAGSIWIDLGGGDGRVVRIAPDGWAVTYEAAPRFYEPAGMRPLPPPRKGRALRKLQMLLNLSDESYVLVLAFLLNCLRPAGPYFCLLVEGEQGSGKSFLCKLVKLIIDPRRLEKIRLPDGERDLIVAANSHYLLVFDNASGMKGDMSDALCSLATGGGIGLRKLYTDDELHEIDVVRPFIINGITGLVSRPDLMERAIHLTLPAMPPETRRTEKQMLAEFENMLPDLLGELYDLVSCALRNETSVEPPTNVRMADAAHFLQAAEPGTDLEPGTFLRVLTAAQTDLMIERVSNQPIVVRLLAILENGPFNGTMGMLHQQLIDGDFSRARILPSTPAHLSRELQRQKPAMEKAGIFMRDRKSRRGKEVYIWLEDVEAHLFDDKPPF